VKGMNSLHRVLACGFAKMFINQPLQSGQSIDFAHGAKEDSEQNGVVHRVLP
jgi:hypothetical protein